MSAKRGPGRPPLSDEPLVRTSVRMPEGEHALVQRAAEAAGVSLAEYMRRAGVERARRAARRKEEG